MATKFFKPIPKRNEPTHAEVNRAKDFWTEVFQDVIVAQIGDSSVGRSKAQDITRFAGEVADAALEEMEIRWHKM